jgi:phospholipase/lecithinase/hemolysin
MPDFFSLLTNIIAYPTNYTVTNALLNGLSIDAVDNSIPSLTVTNNPGTNYIFWDTTDPTAKVHMWMANLAQQLISPVQISNLTVLNGSNQLVMANVPIGQNGLVIGRTNLVLGSWTTNATFVSSNTTQTVYVPASGPQWFYRLKFPYTWSWP